MSFATIAGGVPFGAMKACQTEASNPGKPDSAMVGASGIVETRWALSAASTRSLPSFTSGRTSTAFTATSGSCPPSTSVIAGLPPLYGMCVSWMPAPRAKSSVARWGVEPCPGDP